MNDRYGRDDREDRHRYRRQSGGGSYRSRDYDDAPRQSSQGQYGQGSNPGWRSEDQDWRSRSEFDRDRAWNRFDHDDGYRSSGGGSTFGYGDGYAEGRVGGYGGSSGGFYQSRDERTRQSQGDSRQPYSSSGYGYAQSQPGASSQQPSFTGQQHGWAVPSSYGAPGSAGADYGYGYGGGQGFGDDYREHGYSHEHQRGFLQRAGDEVASWFGDEEAARRREQDHRGRGPQDYTRSDERIREDANDRLTEDWRVDASGISVKVEDGEVTLSGSVSRREDKRRAEDIVEDISGVKHVQNNLRVRQADAWGSGGSAGTSVETGTSSAAGSGTATSSMGSAPATGSKG
jgi:osmotically-inducible protein OsmY